MLEIVLLGAQCYALYDEAAQKFLSLTEDLDFESLHGTIDADRQTGYLDQLFNATVIADRILTLEVGDQTDFPRWKDYILRLRKRIMRIHSPKTYDAQIQIVVKRN